ncbi:tyrosine recombinase xerC 2 [Candidatus Scalindua japonica]|uniref:Tyrosine recombinase xerC 2 n=1 Tax=Candidatus Scalindua japonica TaxID=1284222 RepID=A0A286TYF7_9BACT|nr:tyrosine-type recombinase/integrase [Candidatus Scalindua japonica]GAX60910.1 tyrosine recombinase xerC 2 [Candidatus Scalindua japonica]
MKEQMKASAYHLKPAEIKKLIVAAPNFRDRCIIKTLYWLGLRRSELVELDVRDIDYERKRVTVQRVTVRQGKGGKIRIVPIVDDEFVSDIKHLIGDRKSGAVFLSTHNKPLSNRALNYIVADVGEKAGIKPPQPKRKNINPHIFRHSIARFLKSKGFTAEWIQNFLGHQSYKTTMDMYGTIGIDEMQEIAERKLNN